MTNIRAALVLIALLVSPVLAEERSRPVDLVPDAQTATAIARAVLVARFGQERVAAQEPLVASPNSRDTWLVGGIIKDEEGCARGADSA